MRLAGASSRSPDSWNAGWPRCAEIADAIRNKAWAAYSDQPAHLADRPGFPPLQRARIVALACLEPIAKGLHITHWSRQELARQIVHDGIVAQIHPRTISKILEQVDLQPHRTRYWKTSHLDEEFKHRAEQVLWCYAQAQALAAQDIWVVCADEIPNYQLLERNPIVRAIPGYIERQEFEYTRHGTVNLVMFLIVHTGKMAMRIIQPKDAPHYTAVLRWFRRMHPQLRGIFLIQDNDPCHTASLTQDYFAQHRAFWRPRYLPVHASWLNQCELLNGVFSRLYLKRTSWTGRRHFLETMPACLREYNLLHAHPFEWTWTSHKMRRWFEQHSD